MEVGCVKINGFAHHRGFYFGNGSHDLSATFADISM